RWCCFPQSFHEFLFPVAVFSIAVKTKAIQQCCLTPEAYFDSKEDCVSAATVFDSRQSGVSAAQYFRPKAFFGCRL
ncbi:MAG: hypothetical protein ACLP5H_30970, partial [Desulfomonilaceae bacterium]